MNEMMTTLVDIQFAERDGKCCTNVDHAAVAVDQIGHATSAELFLALKDILPEQDARAVSELLAPISFDLVEKFEEREQMDIICGRSDI